MTVVEFALLAPVALVLLIGILIAGIFAMNYVQLQNAVRDGARAAAVCGGAARSSNGNQQTLTQTTLLPNGQACSSTNLIAYVKSRFQAIPGNAAQLTVTLPSSGLDDCSYKNTVELVASYPQPLYIPIISNLLSNDGSGSTFTISAKAEATCEI